MKRITVSLISVLLIIMLSATSALADQGNDRHSPPRHRPINTGPDGFRGGIGEMDITGNVSVEDAIIITLEISPSGDMQDRMKQNRPGGMETHPEDFTNIMTVRIESLIEFIDVDNNGYSANDTIVSQYFLNNTNLELPTSETNESGTVYTINSFDASFTMYLYLNEEDEVPHSWKWSVEINYGFVQSETQLAIVQSIDSHGTSRYHHRNTSQNNQNDDCVVNQTRFMDDHPNVPMFFKWDETAIVDDTTMNVTASFLNGYVAISIPQGSNIFYDPEIGVDISILEENDLFLQNLFQEFADTVNSPTVIGLIIASGIIVTVVLFTRFRN